MYGPALKIRGLFCCSPSPSSMTVYFLVALLALYTSVHPPQPRISWRDAELYVNRFAAQQYEEIELGLSTTSSDSSPLFISLCIPPPPPTSELFFILEMAYAIGRLWVRLVGERGLKEITEVSSLQRRLKGDTFLSNGFKLKGICVMVNYYKRHSSTDM